MNWDQYLNAGRLRPSKRELNGADNRNEFESDYGRVIFSPATRRMHDKTQVQPLTTDDNVHSRLTHSMEAMAIGYSIGIRLCEDKTFIAQTGLDKHKIEREIPIILQNACLVHDIGNPPFGHFGETIIQSYFKKLFTGEDGLCKIRLSAEQKDDFIYYDGNAQGFRVLTKLQYRNDIFGLNLTYAVLATFLKYPCTKIDKSRKDIATKKQGVFSSEKDYLDIIADACGLRREDGTIMRHPLTFLVEAADNICYLIMDIEDGFNKKWYTFDFIRRNLGGNIECQNIIKKIEDNAIEEGRNTSDISDIEYMVGFRIGIIAYLISTVITNFLGNLDVICQGKYHAELLGENNVAQNLQDFCFKHVYNKRNILSLELTGHSVISGLLNYYIDFLWGYPNDEAEKDNDYQKRVRGLLSNSIIKVALIENELPSDANICRLSDYNKLRIIVDYISGMTDQFALNHYQKLSGQKII